MELAIKNLNAVVDLFQVPSRVDEIIPWSGGHINYTYKVKCANGSGFILQELNTHVFSRYHELMQNMIAVTSHILSKQENEGLVAPLIKTKTDDYWIENELGVWRMHSFVDGKSSYDVAKSEELCRKAGRSYGAFLSAVNDFPIDELHLPIPKFHDIRFRLGQFQEALNDGDNDRIEQVQDEISQIESLAVDFIQVYERAIQNHPVRVTHNDTKLNNVLIGDEELGTVIDLDTVMPGFTFFDVGDALRSMAISAKEDDQNVDSIALSMQKKEAFLDGYFSMTKDILTKQEIAALSKSGAYMAYIMAVRFLTDFLNGDVYYKTEYRSHNHIRAKNQLRVCELFSDS